MAKKKSKTGRKKLPQSEKTILVGFYTKQKNVDTVGGIENARFLAKEHIEKLNGYLGSVPE